MKQRGVVDGDGSDVGGGYRRGGGGLRASKGLWVLASRLKVILVNGEGGRGISFTIATPMRFVLWQ